MKIDAAEAARLARWYRGIAADYRAAADRVAAGRNSTMPLNQLLDAADAAELQAYNWDNAAEDLR